MQDPIFPPDPNFYKELLDHIGDGVYFVDRERRFLYWNEGATRLTGYKAEEILGKRCQDDILCHTDHSGKRLCNDGCPLTASIADGAFHQANVLLRHKKGRQVPVSVRVQPMRAADGTVIGAIEIFSDNSAEIEALRKTKAMNRMAFLDHLTQLPNRRFLQMSLQTALTEFRVHKESVGVLVIDLDMFKGINDSYGHSCATVVPPGPPPVVSVEVEPPSVPVTRPDGAPNRIEAPDLARRISVSAISRL